MKSSNKNISSFANRWRIDNNVKLKVLIFTLLYKANIKNEFMHKHITNISMLTLDIYLASFITDRIVYKEILKGFTFTQETYLYIMIPLIIASFALAYIIAIIRKKFIKLR